MLEALGLIASTDLKLIRIFFVSFNIRLTTEAV